MSESTSTLAGSQVRWGRGPWCNWQHVSPSSFKVRVRVPSGPQHSPFGRGSGEEFVTGELLKSSLDLSSVAFDNHIELDGLTCYPELNSRSGYRFFGMNSPPDARRCHIAASTPGIVCTSLYMEMFLKEHFSLTRSLFSVDLTCRPAFSPPWPRYPSALLCG